MIAGQYPPYWWLRRLRRRNRDKLVSYGHCALCRSMWFVSDGWDVEEAVEKARHRPWCVVKLSKASSRRLPALAGDGRRHAQL